MKFFYLFLLILMSISLSSQTINPEYFDKIIMSSDFNSTKDAKIWPSENSTDEVIVMNNHEYLIDRKNIQKDRMVFPNYLNPYPNYEFTTSLVLENLQLSTQVAGVCFNFSKNLDQGFILEFNKKKQFRIRQLTSDGKISYITGSNNSNSWKKSNMIYPKDGSNEIDIKVLGNLVELYINSYFAYSFEKPLPYHYRNFGLFAGRGSKAVFKNVQLLISYKDQGKYDNITEDEIVVENNNPIVIIPDQPEIKDTATIVIKPKNDQIETPKTENLDQKKTLELIVNLKNELSENQKKLEATQYLLDQCKKDNIELNDFVNKNLDNKMQTRVAALEKENEQLKDQVAKLKTENTTLLDFKTYYLNQNKDKDIVNFLYDELKKIEEKNAYLNRQVTILQEQLKKPIKK